MPSEVLAEQINPVTGEPLSILLLTWNHATFIIAVQKYLDKYISLESCEVCAQPKYAKKRR